MPGASFPLPSSLLRIAGFKHSAIKPKESGRYLHPASMCFSFPSQILRFVVVPSPFPSHHVPFWERTQHPVESIKNREET